MKEEEKKRENKDHIQNAAKIYIKKQINRKLTTGHVCVCVFVAGRLKPTSKKGLMKGTLKTQWYHLLIYSQEVQLLIK